MLSATDLRAGYDDGVPVLDAVDLAVAPGETVGLAGPSGCGKSTLVRVLALLHEPWQGTVSVDGEAARRFRYRAPARVRRRVAVVFQSPRRSADPRFTLRRIIEAPLRTVRPAPDRIERRVAELAERVGLTADLLDRRPHEVSDGQLQRASLARALAVGPRYLLCDELTAMLDASTTAALVEVARRACADEHVGVLAVSHDRELLDVWADRTVSLGKPDRDTPDPAG